MAGEKLFEKLSGVILDTRRIMATDSARPSSARWATWRSYMRLAVAPRREASISILGWRVRYLDSTNLVHLFREIFVNRLYEVHLESRSPTIVDCGSNIGLSILFFKSLYPDATVLGFEPSPQIFPVLQENVASNKLQGVTLHQRALADR